MDIRGKLLEYCKLKGLKKSDFTRKTGVPNSFFNKNSGITTDTLEAIFTNLEDLSPDWLLTGKGEMLRNVNPTQPDSPQQSNPMHVDIEAIKLLIEEKDRSIATLTAQIADLRSQLKVKDEQLAAKDAQLAARDRMMCKLMGVEDSR